MSVICKLRCQHTGKPGKVDEEGFMPAATVSLHAVWAGSVEAQANSENTIFGKYSPMADLKLAIANPTAFRQFIPGLEYYVRIEAATPITEELIKPLRLRKMEWEERLGVSQERLNAATVALTPTQLTGGEEYLAKVLEEPRREVRSAKDQLEIASYHLEAALELYTEQQRV